MNSRATTAILIIIVLIIIVKVVMIKVIEDDFNNNSIKVNINVTNPITTTVTKGEKYDLAMTCVYVSKQFYKKRDPPNLHWVEIYIISMFKYKPKGKLFRLVIFIDRRTKEYFENSKLISPYISDISLIEVQIEIEFKGMDWADLDLIGNAPNNFRFLLYKRYIAANLHNIDRVIISDSTDVMVQRDPFLGCGLPAGLKTPTVIFTYEVTRKMDFYNKNWLRCYPGDIYNNLKKKTVSCAGVVLGTALGILRYTTLQVEQLSTQSLMTCSISKIKASLDQATHNYLLHYANSSMINSVTVDHSEACAFHGNYGHLKVINNEVVNGSGTPYALVHQYTDRHKAVMDIATSLYLI